MSQRQAEAETLLSEACTTRASWLGNWTAGTGELTGKVLDDDLDYRALLETLHLNQDDDESDGEGEEGAQEGGDIFVERQVAALLRVARLRGNGFFVSELSQVEKVLRFALTKIQEWQASSFIEPACRLLKCSGKPFVGKSTTDDMKYAEEKVSFVRTLSLGLDSEMPSEVILHATEAFASLSILGTTADKVDTYITDSGILLQANTCLRTLLYNSVSGKRKVGDTVIFLLLKALDICIISDDIAALLVDNGLFSCIAVIFANYNSRERVTIACQVVRNILDVSSESVGVKTTEFCEAIMSLYDQVPVSTLFFESLSGLLEDTVFRGFGMQDKDLRNEICLLVLMLAKNAENRAAIATSNLLNTIFFVATQPEVLSKTDSTKTTQALIASSNKNIRAFASTREPEDLELKLLTWYMVVEISKGMEDNEIFLEKLKESQLISCLLLYLEDEQGKRVMCLKRWAPYQLQHLKGEAIWTLAALVNMLPGEFLSANGLNLTLFSISNVTSFQILQAFMQLLHQLSKIPMLKLQLSKKGVVGAVLQIFRDFSRTKASWTGRGADPSQMLKLGMPLGTESYFVQQDAAGVLIAFCTKGEEEDIKENGEDISVADLNLRHFLQCEGVEMVVQELNELYEEGMSFPASYTLSLLHVLWQCVVKGSQGKKGPQGQANLRTFLVLGGMELLLDIALVSDSRVCSVILSILADAIERGGARAKAIWHQWRSSSSPSQGAPGPAKGGDPITATHMLLEKWREEERARRLTNNRRFIQNLSRPLSGLSAAPPIHQYQEGCHGALDGFIDTMSATTMKAKATLANGAASDHLQDLSVFPRVHAVLKLLDFGGPGALGDGGESGEAALPCEDRATMQFIKEYVKFKQGEVWLDIADSFDRDGVVLTDFDQSRLESGMAASYLLAEQVQEKQREILEGGFLMDTMKEQSFYDSILVQQQQERAGLLYKKDRGNLTMRERLEAKMKKEQMLKNSVRSAMDSLSQKNTMNATADREVQEVDEDEDLDAETVAVAAAVAEAVAEALADEEEDEEEEDGGEEDSSSSSSSSSRSSSPSSSSTASPFDTMASES